MLLADVHVWFWKAQSVSSKAKCYGIAARGEVGPLEILNIEYQILKIFQTMYWIKSNHNENIWLERPLRVFSIKVWRGSLSDQSVARGRLMLSHNSSTVHPVSSLFRQQVNEAGTWSVDTRIIKRGSGLWRDSLKLFCYFCLLPPRHTGLHWTTTWSQASLSRLILGDVG